MGKKGQPNLAFTQWNVQMVIWPTQWKIQTNESKENPALGSAIAGGEENKFRQSVKYVIWWSLPSTTPSNYHEILKPLRWLYRSNGEFGKKWNWWNSVKCSDGYLTDSVKDPNEWKQREPGIRIRHCGWWREQVSSKC